MQDAARHVLSQAQPDLIISELWSTAQVWSHAPIEGFRHTAMYKSVQAALGRVRCSPAETETRPLMQSSIVHYHGDAYEIVYDPDGGPCGMGKMVLSPHGRAPTSTDVSEFLKRVAALE